MKIFLPSIDIKAQRTLLEQQLQQFFPEHQFYDLPELILTLREKLAPSVISGIENSRLNEYILYIEKGLGERIKMIRVLAISVMAMIKRQYITSLYMKMVFEVHLLKCCFSPRQCDTLF